MAETKIKGIKLDEEEQWYEDHSDEFVPEKNQVELRKELMEAARSAAETRRTRKTITINLDTRAIDYFRYLASETGVSYQTLMNMYLVQCAMEKKRVTFV